MGRKNRNARGRSYTSFESMKNTTVQFDLSNTNFRLKNRHMGDKTISEEVGISLIKGGANQDMCVSWSIREDLGQMLTKEYGKYWTCGIVREGVFERLYFIPNEMGYSLYTNKQATRYYTKVVIENRAEFEKYIGHHKLQYDDHNDAYYILAGE